MRMIGRFLSRAFFWTYERGSFPWDLCCLFIIAIIFSTPADFLTEYSQRPLGPDQIHDLVVAWLASLLTG